MDEAVDAEVTSAADAAAQRQTSVVFNADSTVTTFAEIIQVRATPEAVVLYFSQRIPGEAEATEAPGAQVYAAIGMSWPHFFRFSKMVERIRESNKERVLEALQKSFD